MKRRLGVLLCGMALLLCCGAVPSFATCYDCDATSHCVAEADGLGAWCVSVCNSAGCSCGWGGSCIGGGCDPGEPCDTPPIHHFGAGEQEARQQRVRDIIAGSLSNQDKIDQLVQVATWQEIETWCAATPGCTSGSKIDAVTAAKFYTWGRLKMLYR